MEIKRVEIPLILRHFESQLPSAVWERLLDEYNDNVRNSDSPIGRTFDNIESWYDCVTTVRKLSSSNKDIMQKAVRAVTDMYFTEPVKLPKIHEAMEESGQRFDYLKSHVGTEYDFILGVCFDIGLLQGRDFFDGQKVTSLEDMICVISQKLSSRYQADGCDKVDTPSFIYDEFRRWYSSSFTHRIGIGADVILFRSALGAISGESTQAEFCRQIKPIRSTVEKVSGQKYDSYIQGIFTGERLGAIKAHLKENMFYAWYREGKDNEWYYEQLRLLSELIDIGRRFLLGSEVKSFDIQSELCDLLRILEEHRPLSLQIVHELKTISYVSFPIIASRKLLGNFIGASIVQGRDQPDPWFFYNSLDFERNFKEEGKSLSTIVNDVLRPLLLIKAVQDPARFSLEYIEFLCRQSLTDRGYLDVLVDFIIPFMQRNDSFLRRCSLRRCGHMLQETDRNATLLELVGSIIDRADYSEADEVSRYLRDIGVLYEYVREDESKAKLLTKCFSRLFDIFKSLKDPHDRQDVVLAIEDIFVSADLELQKTICEGCASLIGSVETTAHFV